MFRLPITISIGALIILGGLMAYFVIHVRSYDHERYEALLESSRHAGRGIGAKAAQVRSDVSKTIWNEALSCVINSKRSIVEIAQGDAMQATECLEDVVCHLTQGNLIRHIAAEKAQVDYTAYLLEGEMVSYKTEGEQKIFGRAKKVKLPLKRELPWAELKGDVVIDLADQGTFLCDAIFLDHTQETTHFKGDPQLRYTDARGSVLADEALVTFQESNGRVDVLKITLYGSVNLSNPTQTQYALAERVELFPTEENILLTGKTQRVLFIDREKEIQLSAWMISVDYHEGEKVQGFGDVRCILRPEELDTLKRRFGADA